MWAALLGATYRAGAAVAQRQAKAEHAAMPGYTARQFHETTTFSVSAATGNHGGNELNQLSVRAAGRTVSDLTTGEKLKAGLVGWSADVK